jgi:hypothetical protein
MSDERAYLAAKYAEFETDELLELYRSGLTMLAEDVAAAELSSRGVAVPETKSAGASTADEYAGDLVVVARCSTPSEAHVLQACLHAAGVPAALTDAGLVQANSLLTVAVGGVRVLVPQKFVEQAHEVVAALERGDFQLDDDADVWKL